MKRATFGNIKLSFLKEIGISKHFIARKSQKIGKIENMFCKRHLTTVFNSSIFDDFNVDFWQEITQL